MPRTRRPYPPEFRRQIVELVHAGRTPEELAEGFEPSSVGAQQLKEEIDWGSSVRL